VWRIADSGEISNSPHTGLETVVLPGVKSKLPGAVRALGFIDYNGVFQGRNPTVDTRGVELPGGSEIFVDVYPNMPLPP
jgi:hypothetical protein